MSARGHIGWIFVLASLGTIPGTELHAQCPNDNTLNSAGATPACPGSITVPCVQGGQYVLVNVVAGNTYTFSTCGGATWDTQITLYNNAGGGALGYNDDACGLQSTVTWTASFTGQLRVLVDRYNCANQNSCAALNIQCTAPVTGGNCIYVLTMNDSWGDGWGSSNVGVSINGAPWQYYTVTGSTNSVSFAMTIGQVISLSYNNSGAWQNENSFTLSIQGGGVIYSSGTPPPAGVVFTQTVSCTPPPAAAQDCVGGQTICSGQAFNNNSNNTGAVVDLNSSNQGCLSSGEQQGTWYYFSPSTGGTIGFTIAPTANIDYDFAVWGPLSTVSCPPSAPPIRCSYASGFSTFNATGSYNTGLGNGATDFTEGANGNGWVAPLTVTAGQVYILYIDNFSSTGQSFSLSWSLSNGASLDCTLLPVELLSFTASQQGPSVELEWSTASEHNSAYFTVERAADNLHYEAIGTLAAAGESSQVNQYRLTDGDPRTGVNYYRLIQTDADGQSATSPVQWVRFSGQVGIVYPNPTQGLLHVDLAGGLPGSIAYRLLDMTGRAVRAGSWTSDGGQSTRTLDLQMLAPGNYLLELVHPDGSRQLLPPLVRR
jgi:hypothetical protein